MTMTKKDLKEAENLYRKLLGFFDIKQTPERKDTPARYARFLRDFTSKVSMPEMTMFPLEGSSEMIIIKNVSIRSLCEHHVLPFMGRAYIGYIPNKKILGLSKIPRLVHYFARDLTTQETLGNRIADALMEIPGLDPIGVGVAIECFHTCMSIRGVCEASAFTRSTALRGELRFDAPRSEFLDQALKLTAFDR